MRINFMFMGNKLTTQQLEKILKDRGIDELQFKKELEIYPQMYNLWKKRGIPSDRLRSLADQIGISIDELQGRKQPTPKSKTDRQDLYEIIDKLPPRLLTKARSALKFFVVEEAQAVTQGRKKKT